ncbi:uncharacterized protein LOC143258130 isoform X2 [Tachypleus tridentatus]|uniref:uncharacterized protein LOC143258130 isoform X2 n=1 Tax=Tachypleus tridentatus TaxID=6853 RepID=UPI003FD382BE
MLEQQEILDHVQSQLEMSNVSTMGFPLTSNVIATSFTRNPENSVCLRDSTTGSLQVNTALDQKIQGLVSEKTN